MKTSRDGAILARDEGRFARGTAGNLRIKIGAAESGGSLSLVEYEILPRRRTVPHYHLKIYESVFVSEGALLVRVGDTWTMQAAGTTISYRLAWCTGGRTPVARWLGC